MVLRTPGSGLTPFCTAWVTIFVSSVISTGGAPGTVATAAASAVHRAAPSRAVGKPASIAISVRSAEMSIDLSMPAVTTSQPR